VCNVICTAGGGSVGGHFLTTMAAQMHSDSRAIKRTRYLDAARQILQRDGLDALTMQALANQVGAAVGTMYGYFPSKGALVTELQKQAITTIIGAWRDARAVWTAALDDRGLTHPDIVLAEVVAFGEFFLAIQVDYSLEFDLNRAHLDDRNELFESVDLNVVRPTAADLVQGPAEAIEAGIDAGVLQADVAEIHERVLMLLLGLYGISLLAISRPETTQTLVPDLTRMLVRDLTLGWGADRGALDRVTPIVRAVIDEHPLSSIGAADQRVPVTAG